MRGKMLDSAISFLYTTASRLGYSHPFHPTQVHFPVGLIFGAFVLAVAGKVRRQPMLSKAAWYCMVIALIWLLPSAVTGLMDWKHFYAGVLLFPFIMKFILAAGLTILVAAGVLLGARRGPQTNSLVALSALCLLTTAGLGFFGGELVYGNKSAPAEEKGIQASDYKPGMDLYAANCGGCHANGGNVINPRLPVKRSPKTEDLATFVAWIRNPRAPMPAYPSGVLSDRQAEEIYQYVVKVLNRS